MSTESSLNEYRMAARRPFIEHAALAKKLQLPLQRILPDNMTASGRIIKDLQNQADQAQKLVDIFYNAQFSPTVAKFNELIKKTSAPFLFLNSDIQKLLTKNPLERYEEFMQRMVYPLSQPSEKYLCNVVDGVTLVLGSEKKDVFNIIIPLSPRVTKYGFSSAMEMNLNSIGLFALLGIKTSPLDFTIHSLTELDLKFQLASISPDEIHLPESYGGTEYEMSPYLAVKIANYKTKF